MACDLGAPLSVVIPCYNESATILEILRRVASVPVVREIIVVDDASTDGTREILRETLQAWSPSRPALRVLLQPVNRGKGAALRAAFPLATGDLTAIQDADLEYDPREFPKVIQPILDGDADVVYGSRFAGWPRRVLYFWHSVGNRLITALSNMTTNLNLTDIETCYKVFKTEIIKSIPIRCDRFGFEPEITAKIAKLGCRVYEVPISYRGRSYAEGKKITAWDAVKALGVIFRFWLVDDLGLERGAMTLKLLEKASHYNRWIHETIRPYLGRDIVEVGAGIGNITRYLLPHGRVTATDMAPAYLAELRRSFGAFEHVRVKPLDISRNSFPESEIYDTVVCLNVLEHVEDDAEALRNMRRLLRPGGRAVVFVPANPRLYCEIDRGVGHHRRYLKEELGRKLVAAGFRLEHLRYHNTIGALGWWFHGKVLRRKALTGGAIRGFDWTMPLLRLLERIESRFSLSVLAVGRKP